MKFTELKIGDTFICCDNLYVKLNDDTKNNAMCIKPVGTYFKKGEINTVANDVAVELCKITEYKIYRNVEFGKLVPGDKFMCSDYRLVKIHEMIMPSPDRRPINCFGWDTSGEFKVFYMPSDVDILMGWDE